jgi:RNA 2',3'-cyclic 3'-phosphodiesterase
LSLAPSAASAVKDFLRVLFNHSKTSKPDTAARRTVLQLRLCSAHMRIFVGLGIESEVRQRISEFMTEMRERAPDVRWVGPESLHVTLKFIGEKPDHAVAQLQNKLGQIAAPGFDVAFRGSGFFPTPRSARVFWIGIEAPPALSELAGQIDSALAEVGIPKETRAFSPHLTLARAGSGAPARKRSDELNQRFARLQQRLAQLPAPDFGTMAAREFFLYRSQLSSQGSRYTKIARFELRFAE